jgi:uncharacterized lipoprotein YmbA
VKPWRSPAGRDLGIALLLLLCQACAVSTPSTAYLQLAAISTGSPDGISGDGPSLFIDRVRLPDFLLRDELIRRDDDFSLHYNPYLRWAEPLDLGLQRVLAEELSISLDTRQIRRYPTPAARDTEWRLQVEVDRFERQGEEVQLRARGIWARSDSPDAAVAVIDFDRQRRVESASPGATAEALSELLAAFAGELARGLGP